MQPVHYLHIFLLTDHSPQADMRSMSIVAVNPVRQTLHKFAHVQSGSRTLRRGECLFVTLLQRTDSNVGYTYSIPITVCGKDSYMAALSPVRACARR